MLQHTIENELFCLCTKIFFNIIWVNFRSIIILMTGEHKRIEIIGKNNVSRPTCSYINFFCEIDARGMDTVPSTKLAFYSRSWWIDCILSQLPWGYSTLLPELAISRYSYYIICTWTAIKTNIILTRLLWCSYRQKSRRNWIDGFCMDIFHLDYSIADYDSSTF